MADIEELKLTVTLVDNATAGLTTLRGQMQQLTQPTQQLQQHFQVLAQTTLVLQRNLQTLSNPQHVAQLQAMQAQLTQVTTGMGRVNASAARTSAGMQILSSTVRGAVAGIAAALAAEFGAKALQNFANEMEHINNAARGMGVVPAQLKNIVDQMKIMGLTSDQAIGAVAAFTRAIDDMSRVGSQMRANLIGKAQGGDPAAMATWLSQITGFANAGQMEEAVNELVRGVQNAYRNELQRTQGSMIQAAGLRNRLLREMGLDESSFAILAERAERFRNMTAAEKQAQAARVEAGKSFNEEWRKSTETVNMLVSGIQSELVTALKLINAAMGTNKQSAEEWGRVIGAQIRGITEATLFLIKLWQDPIKTTAELPWKGMIDKLIAEYPTIVKKLMASAAQGPLGLLTAPARFAPYVYATPGSGSQPETPRAPPGPLFAPGALGPQPGVGAGAPARQHGGPVHGGRGYTVGERGPETFVPGTGGRIFPPSYTSEGQQERTIERATERGVLNAMRQIEREKKADEESKKRIEAIRAQGGRSGVGSLGLPPAPDKVFLWPPSSPGNIGGDPQGRMVGGDRPGGSVAPPSFIGPPRPPLTVPPGIVGSSGITSRGGSLGSFLGQLLFGGSDVAPPAAPEDAIGGAAEPRQHGGRVYRGRRYLVGERGPETFMPQMGGSIFPGGMRETDTERVIERGTEKGVLNALRQFAREQKAEAEAEAKKRGAGAGAAAKVDMDAGTGGGGARSTGGGVLGALGIPAGIPMPGGTGGTGGGGISLPSTGTTGGGTAGGGVAIPSTPADAEDAAVGAAMTGTSGGGITVPGTGGGGAEGAGLTGLARDRAKFAAELQGNPALRDKVLRIAANEQGKNPGGTQAVLESMMNRASSRGRTLAQEARWVGEGGYYAEGNKGRGALENPAHKAILEKSLASTLGGSNISDFATDNASQGLAAKRRANREMEFTKEIGGESFFRPGRVSGQGNVEKHRRWMAGLDRTPTGPAVAGAPAPVASRGVTGGGGATTNAPPIQGFGDDPSTFGGGMPFGKQFGGGFGDTGGGGGGPIRPPSTGGSGSGDFGRVVGALPNQSDRPGRIGGTVTVGGQTFDWASGGSKRGSIPYGTHNINIGQGDIGDVGKRIGSVATLGGLGGVINDPKYPGAPRAGMQIHSGSGATLDTLYTQGCFAVPRPQWPAFKSALLEASRQGPLALSINRAGQAEIHQRGQPPVNLGQGGGQSGGNIPQGQTPADQTQGGGAGAGGGGGMPSFPGMGGGGGMPGLPGGLGSILGMIGGMGGRGGRGIGGILGMMGGRGGMGGILGMLMSGGGGGGINIPSMLSGLGGDVNRRAFDQSATNNVNVNGTGSLRVDVNAPQGTRVAAQGGGLFQNIEMNRAVQMEHARTGSMFNTEGSNTPPMW